MGLMSKKEAEAEEKQLRGLGVFSLKTEENSIDDKREISFNTEKDNDKCISNNAKHKLLKVETYGVKDGTIQHNYPCPVCLSNQATYMNDGVFSFFAPCPICRENGYDIVRNNKKRNWFF